MTCICKPETSIPKEDRIEFLVPIKGSNAFKLADLYNKKCEEHGIRDLTPDTTPAKNSEIVTEEENKDVTDPNLEAPSNEEDTSST
jgi:hypothetical protein